MRNSLHALLVAAVVLALGSPMSHGQAKYTASRTGDLQLGAGYTNGSSDYVTNRIAGYSGYATFDFKEHFGVEFDFHQANDPNSAVYQRSYEWGGRYLRHYANDRYRPYVRVMYGRGVFNFPFNVANLAYNMIVGAGGMDIANCVAAALPSAPNLNTRTGSQARPDQRPDADDDQHRCGVSLPRRQPPLG